MALTGESGFRRLGTEEAFKGRFRVVDVAVEVPGGDRVVRQVTEHPGAATIIALDTRDGKAVEPGVDIGRLETVLIRQYRAAVDAVCTELPAGKLDVVDGRVENPTLCARRELVEEAGLDAADMTPIGDYWVSPGWTDERMYVFVARGLLEVPKAPQTPEEAHMQVSRTGLENAIEMIRTGEICDAKSMLGFSLLRHWLDSAR